MKRFFKCQKGMSLPLVIGVVGLGVAVISNVITSVLPKLQSEKNKAESMINYRIFMASVNDYLLHGIRERWCLNVVNGNETDLLLSNNCSSEKQMEEIVTYPGNLERILWVKDNIGSTPPEPGDNRILAINYNRVNSTPPKATRLLTAEDIQPKNGKLTYRITREIFNDMTEQHPLYVIARPVKDCLESVDIEIFQVNDINNIQSGDERKIGIEIKTNISYSKISCYSVRTATSRSYYTFYPRRLHSFSLLKYGKLDGKFNNSFHGPVYVAGDFVLPSPDYDKKQSSVFHSTLTLGVYNEGKGSGSLYRAGKVVDSFFKDYTFTERGHPYDSKQNNYPGFRGFLGGVHLDSSEDKGFYNLFNHTNTSSGDVGKLEECIEEANAQTNYSVNSNSTLGYSEYAILGPESSKFKMSFTKRNRFKEGDMSGPYHSDREYRDYSFKVSGTNKAFGDLTLTTRSASYSASTGSNVKNIMVMNIDRFNENESHSRDRDRHRKTTDFIEDALEEIEEAEKANKESLSSYYQREELYRVISDKTFLNKMPQLKNYQEAAKKLHDRCIDKVGDECLNFGFSESKQTCTNDSSKLNDKIKDICNYSSELSAYNFSKNILVAELKAIDNLIKNGQATMSVELYGLMLNDKKVLNQKELKVEFSPLWLKVAPMIEPDPVITFAPYHYSNRGHSISVDFPDKSRADMRLRISSFFGSADTKMYSDTWRRTYNNEVIEPAPKPIVDMDCPEGMGLADWDLDMSGSSNFAWNYANTPPGAVVDSSDHEMLSEIVFTTENLEGHSASTTKSVVDHCIIPPERTHVYGFYVCNKLTIEERTTPLYMVGTFIVNDLIQKPSPNTVYWHSVWDQKAADLIMNDLNASNAACSLTSDSLITKTFKDINREPALKAKITACSAQDLINNGPNNFSWTTVDPDIGLANPTDTMTSQKANRIAKWVIKEESRTELVR